MTVKKICSHHLLLFNVVELGHLKVVVVDATLDKKKIRLTSLDYLFESVNIDWKQQYNP